MLKMYNVNDSKSDWKISETHILIPMVDGDLVTDRESDKILTSTITLNPVEGSDQSILTSTLEHSLLVGLDKNLFDTTNYKSDILIIQNSDLKLFPYNTDFKFAYALSSADENKSETLWQNPMLKDRICASGKAIFEVRHVLDYDELELEKINEHNNLGSMANDSMQATKPDKENLIEKTSCQKKDITDSQFIVSYNSDTENREIISNSFGTEVSKPAENLKLIKNQKLIEINTHSDVGSSSFKVGVDFEETIFNSTQQNVTCSNSSVSSSVEHVKLKTDKKQKLKPKKHSILNQFKVKSKCNIGVSDSLPEKNLPLKKKAKMKKTLMVVNSENLRSLLKQDIINSSENLKFSFKGKMKQSTNSIEESENSNRESEPLMNSTKMHQKIKLKSTSLNKNSQIKEVGDGLKKVDNYLFEENEIGTSKIDSFEFDRTKFANIYDLIECLRKCRIINATVWQTLNFGLKEMKVDILKEMNTKMKENCLPESKNYSPQLKAFALVLYFKQPAAFNHISQVYKNGWPSLNVIKEWKRRMNSHHRLHLLRIQSDNENNKS